jgi:hypothetical protein
LDACKLLVGPAGWLQDVVSSQWLAHRAASVVRSTAS